MGASFYDPYALRVAPNDDVYVVDDVDCRIRKISGGVVTTVAGGAGCGFSGDNGPATLAQLNRPSDVVLDNSGNVLIADRNNCRVREVSGGVITTLVGGAGCSDLGDGGPANAAGLSGAMSLAVDASDRLYIATACRIRVVDAGTINSIAGSDCGASAGDGGPALAARVHPQFLAVSAGGLYFSEANDAHAVRVVNNGIVNAVVGHQGSCPGGSSGSGPAIDACVNAWQIAVDGNGDLYVSDQGLCRIRKVDHTSGQIDTIVGSSCDIPPVPTPVSGITFVALRGFTVDASGQVYAGDYRPSSSGPECEIFTTGGGFVTPLAAVTPCGFSGDGQAAADTPIGYPGVLRVGGSGDVYFIQGCAVRRVHNGVVGTVAGQPGCASSSWGTTTMDGVLATDTSLRGAADLALDSIGGFYVAEPCTIRYVASSGVISTVAGNVGCAGGAEGAAGTVSIPNPAGLAVGPNGGLYFGVGCRVSRLSGGAVATVAGSATTCGYAGDGGLAKDALLDSVTGVALADDGSMSIFSDNCIVRRVAASGAIKTFTATGHCSAGFAVDGVGDVFYFDPTSCQIREITSSYAFTIAGRIGTCPQTFGGLDPSYGMLSGDGGPAALAWLTGGNGLAFGVDGNLYIADTWNLRIRVVYQPNVDSDGDGYPDALELAIGKNPALYCAIMRADVDQDGVVSILDLSTVAKYFGQSVPPAPPLYDQDRDNRISILDLSKMAHVFAQHVSACP
jgi:hypothetical protein